MRPRISPENRKLLIVSTSLTLLLSVILTISNLGRKPALVLFGIGLAIAAVIFLVILTNASRE